MIAELNELQAKQIAAGSGISVKPISREGSERIIRFAFEYARAHGRKRVSCVTKANIMKFTDGLFLDVFREVAKDYPEIEPWENLVDAICMGLVQRPGGVRRARAAEPLRRHRQRPDRRARRRPRRRAGRQHRPRHRRLRGDARLGAEVQGPEQGQPDGDDPLRAS